MTEHRSFMRYPDPKSNHGNIWKQPLWINIFSFFQETHIIELWLITLVFGDSFKQSRNLCLIHVVMKCHTKIMVPKIACSEFGALKLNIDWQSHFCGTVFYRQLDQLAPKTNKQIFLAGRAMAVGKWNLSRKRFVAPAYPPSTPPPIIQNRCLPGAFFLRKTLEQRIKERKSSEVNRLNRYIHSVILAIIGWFVLMGWL